MHLSRFVPVLALFALTNAHASSFNDVRARVYALPLANLPHEEGLTPGQFLQAIATEAGAVVTRAKATLSDSSDFKESAPKLLHPMGVCAEAQWSITGASPATGLLAKGTRVRAIVRLSAADGQTEFSTSKKRTFGMAVKLFPTSDDDASVETRNIFTLDQNGLDGGIRERMLDDGPMSYTYFENKAEGGGFLAGLLTKVFKKLDDTPTHRPVDPLTEVTADGSAVAQPATPWIIRFTPEIPAPLHTAKDFRDELRAYNAGEIRFRISLPVQSEGGIKISGHDVAIGELVLGKPVVSTACDRELTFHHHPAR